MVLEDTTLGTVTLTNKELTFDLVIKKSGHKIISDYKPILC